MSSTATVKSKHNRTAVIGLGGLEFYTLRDIRNLLLRRKWMISFTALTIACLVSAFTYFLPNQYKASTLIMVDPGKVPENYVKSTATIDANQRLAMLQEQILSDSRLGKIVDELGLYRTLKDKRPQREIVDAMRKRIDVQPTTTGVPARTLKTFTVSFTAQNSATAAKVSNRLASLFIEENLKVREQQVVGTADFFEDQLRKAKHDLDQKSQRLAELRAQYATELPESQNLHLQALNSAQMALREEGDAISRAQQGKVYLQSLLASSPKIVNLDSSGNDANTGLEEQLERLQGEMDQLRSHYGPSYPDVLNKAAEIQQVKEKIKDLEKQGNSTSGGTKPHNPALEGQIAQVDEEIRKREVRQAELTSQIKFHEAAIQRVPAAQEQLTAAGNDVTAAADRYKRLEDRKFGADMSSDVEARQQGERFVLVDPAQPPEHPDSPNRLLIDGLGVGVGLVIALLAVFLLEVLSPTVKTEREIRERVGVPIFGEIPGLTTTSDARRRTLLGALAAAGNLLLAIGYFGVLAASLNK